MGLCAQTWHSTESGLSKAHHLHHHVSSSTPCSTLWMSVGAVKLFSNNFFLFWEINRWACILRRHQVSVCAVQHHVNSSTAFSSRWSYVLEQNAFTRRHASSHRRHLHSKSEELAHTAMCTAMCKGNTSRRKHTWKCELAADNRSSTLSRIRLADTKSPILRFG